jgi:ribosomal protein S18 acetylase RimI-like enzyme
VISEVPLGEHIGEVKTVVENCVVGCKHLPSGLAMHVSLDLAHRNLSLLSLPTSKNTMSRDWPISKATEDDAVGIASLLVDSWASPFSRLQLGDVEPTNSVTTMAPRIARQINNPNMALYVVHSPVTKEVVAVAQWMLPVDGPVKKETQEEQDERQALEDELYMKSLPERSNKGLIMEFGVGLRTLRDRLLKGEKKHYLLNNIATHHDYRGQGLASRLIEQILQQADAENTIVCLETASDNPAARMYKRLGFEEYGQFTIQDLSKFASKEELDRCGGISKHTHIVFCRRPKGSLK